MQEPLTGHRFDPHKRVHVSGVPPVVPMTGGNLAGPPFSQGRRRPVKPNRQFSLDDAEALDHARVAVFTYHA